MSDGSGGYAPENLVERVVFRDRRLAIHEHIATGALQTAHHGALVEGEAGRTGDHVIGGRGAGKGRCGIGDDAGWRLGRMSRARAHYGGDCRKL